jgi:diacylglycerol kinase (ATP)
MHPLFRALQNSTRGLFRAAHSERAVSQELIGLAIAVPGAWLLSDDLWTYIALLGIVLATLAVELLNSALEKLCDHVTPEFNTQIGAIKDMGSAAVLCLLVLAGLIWAVAIIEAFGR